MTLIDNLWICSFDKRMNDFSMTADDKAIFITSTWKCAYNIRLNCRIIYWLFWQKIFIVKKTNSDSVRSMVYIKFIYQWNVFFEDEGRCMYKYDLMMYQLWIIFILWNKTKLWTNTVRQLPSNDVCRLILAQKIEQNRLIIMYV